MSKRFNKNDIDLVTKILLEQDELWPYSRGSMDHWNDFRHKLERIYQPDKKKTVAAVPTSSGTASIHVALGGLQIPAGSEVILPPITDMGTIMPVIFQNCIPIFADVDLESGVLSADTIACKITDRTKAVIVVHLTGSPADMDPINELCREKGIAVIEDCAQALGAIYKEKRVGTFGDVGAFSLNSQKHLTAGEGGFLLVNGDASNSKFMRSQLFADKYRSRARYIKPKLDLEGEEYKSYFSSGLNYRMSDLELVLASSQLDRLDSISATYTELGRHLDKRLQSIPGVVPQIHHVEATPVYFFCWFRLKHGEAEGREKLSLRRTELYNKLKPVADNNQLGLWKSYGTEPAYEYSVFQNKNFFASFPGEDSIWPAELLAKRSYDYTTCSCPNAEKWCDAGLAIRFNERTSVEQLDRLISALEVEMTAGQDRK